MWRKSDCMKCHKTEKSKVKKSNHTTLKHELNGIENRIAEIEAQENRNLIHKKFKKFSDNQENINLQEVWKVLKSICPKFKKNSPHCKT